MASVSGSTTVAAVKVATTWGTSVAAGAGNRFTGEITYAANATELVSREIGSGNEMVTQATKAVIKPTVSITMDAGYENNFDTFLAQFFGTDSVSAELTASQGDYRHTLNFNTSLNSKYLSVALTDTSSTSLEFPTCAVRSVTVKPQGVPGYVDATFELVANDIVIGSATNTYAVVAATTARSNQENMATAFNDVFWINATSGGSLSSADKVNILDWSFTLTRPQEAQQEITGSTGLGAPIKTGLFEGSVTVTLKELPDHTHFTAWSAETKSKIKLGFDGTQIGSGNNRSFYAYFPQAQLIQEPNYSLSQPGINPVTLTWKLSKAASNPTGMSYTYPYVEIINTKTTQLLA